MSLSQILTPHIEKAVTALFGISLEKIELQATRREFEGDITMVIFPLVKLVKGNPAELGNKIGQYLVDNTEEVERFNVVSGFLNLVISDVYYINFFNEIINNEHYGYTAPEEGGKAVIVEYASPNTNKPLHLGHVRNVLLGYSVAEITKAAGKKVYKTQIINDRGIHICKSMLAWQKFAPLDENGDRETPWTTNNVNLKKGDKFVGFYYVAFEKELQKQILPIVQKFADLDFKEFPELESPVTALQNEIINLDQLLKEKKANFQLPTTINNHFVLNHFKIDSLPFREMIKNIKNDQDVNISEKEKSAFENALKPVATLEAKIGEKAVDVKEFAKKQTPILKEAQEMLRQWEAGDAEVVALWKKMNAWVYEGFDETYANIGVDFDKNYYESDTYLLGKDVVEQGLAKGVFEKDPDGSVWIDLTEDGLDRKIVLRSDGTSVYITQDIGTAIQRVKDFPDVGGMVYTVGNEQDYHFKVLFLILKKLGFDWAESLYHLSYGMVDLPSGKMKSREGTVVDADDLMHEMTATAKAISEELGKLDGYSDEEKERLYKIIGLGALKYYILKVDPKKRILFNPEESVDFAGNTGPFIQYTYARIQSLIRKANFDFGTPLDAADINLHEKEKELIKLVAQFPDVIKSAADSHSPALVANYAYDLVKEYNSFYQAVPVLAPEVQNEKIFRIQLSKKVGETIKSAFSLLGIGVPERM